MSLSPGENDNLLHVVAPNRARRMSSPDSSKSRLPVSCKAALMAGLVLLPFVVAEQGLVAVVSRGDVVVVFAVVVWSSSL